MVGSTSGRPRFSVHNILATNVLKISFLSSGSFFEFSFTVNNSFVAGCAYYLFKCSPYGLSSSSSSSIMLVMYFTRLKLNFFLPMKSIYMPRKLIFLPFLIARPGKYPSILFMTSSTASCSACDNMLSYTYHAMVHCLPRIVLFATHLSYGLTSKPSF